MEAYQSILHDEFDDVINTPSVCMCADGRLVPGHDQRDELAEQIQRISSDSGLGVAMLVLHEQQVRTGHLASQVARAGGTPLNFSVATRILRTTGHAHFLNVPIRAYRGDQALLKQLGIFYRHANENECRKLDHGVGKECFYCSASLRLLREVLPEHGPGSVENAYPGVKDTYTLGFTFAPFGKPDAVCHFLAWDGPKDKDGDKFESMNLGDNSIHDLLAFVHSLNTSIRDFYARKECKNYPRLEGIFNGWAGNSIWHRHFQFCQMENDMPVKSSDVRAEVAKHMNCSILRREWTMPCYTVSGPSLEDVAGVAYRIAQEWQGGREGMGEGKRSLNLYVPSGTAGIAGCEHDECVLFFWPRDCGRVDYRNIEGACVLGKSTPIPDKKGFASIESSGAFIVDDETAWAYLESCTDAQRQEVAEAWHKQVSPDEEEVRNWEDNVLGMNLGKGDGKLIEPTMKQG